MKKSIFIMLLACLLLLPLWAQGATVMGEEERAEIPVGEEIYVEPMWVPATFPRTAAEVGAEAVLAAAHDHTGWVALVQSDFGATMAKELGTGDYYLNGDVEGRITITAGATVRLCLNGHTIDAKEAGSVITAGANAALELYDCDASGNGQGKITGGSGAHGGGIRMNKDAALTMYGGTICGNEVSGYGGGVHIIGGTFDLRGGTISGNSAKNGGGVSLVMGGTFNLHDGAVSENNASDEGGGVYLTGSSTCTVSGGSIADNETQTGGGGIALAQNSTGTMSAGAITGNAAVKNGGGVLVSQGSFAMSGGSITDNEAGILGGGAFMTAGCPFIVSGSAVIKDNTRTEQGADVENNIHLVAGETVTVGGALTSSAYIGVSMDVPGIFTGGTAIDNTTCAAGFFSDNDDYQIGAKNGQLSLGVLLRFQKPEGAAGSVPAPALYLPGDQIGLLGPGEQAPVDPGDVIWIEAPVLTRTGYAHLGWTSDSGRVPLTTVKLMDPTTTLYPIFARKFEGAGSGASDYVIELAYFTELEEDIDLNDYIKFASGVTDTEKDFTFTVAEGSELLEGFSLRDGKILKGSVPQVELGDYTVTFDVSDNAGMATLFDAGFAPETAYGTGQLTLTFRVGKATLLASDFAFIPPANLVYSASAKEAHVEVADADLTGVGQITVHYSQTPIQPGTYTVSIDVTEGTGFRAITGMTDPSWQFTILEYIEPAVEVGVPYWAGGKTTIALTPSEDDLLTGEGTKVLAAQYAGDTMVDMAEGQLNAQGNVVTFEGTELKLNDGWRLFFLGGNYSPLCAKKPLTSTP